MEGVLAIRKQLKGNHVMLKKLYDALCIIQVFYILHHQELIHSSIKQLIH